MVQTIGNPLSWGAKAVGDASRTAGEVATHLGGRPVGKPKVQRIRLKQIKDALGLGWQDVMRFRSDVLALVVIYPIIGFALTFIAFNQSLLPLLFPLAAGFALLGPVASIGMYEISRQHEMGQSASWGSALAALRSRVIGPVMILGAFVLFWFMLWMASAFMIYSATLGPEMPESAAAFIWSVFNTPFGLAMIFMGITTGALFAGVTFLISAVAFPMLIDRSVGVPVAVITSAKVVLKNLFPMLTWGAIITVLLALASLPIFLGLILVLPWLGHATWHLYRMAVNYE